MPSLSIELSARDVADIRAVSELQGDKFGRAGKVSLEHMAASLLRAHLVLMRDCGGILPDGPSPVASDAPPSEKIKGLGGVSLSGGVHVNR